MHQVCRVDVVIVGAGIAGAICAWRAARHGKSVALVHLSPRVHGGFGETVPPEIRPTLTALHLWDTFESLSPRPCWSNSSAWGDERLRCWDYLCSPYGPAYQVSATRLADALRREAMAAGAEVVEGSVRRTSPDGDDHLIAVAAPAGAMAIRSPLVVDASGRRAVVARQLGAKRVTFDRTTAVAAMIPQVHTQQDTTTLVEAAGKGWWYSIPTETGLAVIFITDADLVDVPVAVLPDKWTAALRATTHISARVNKLDTASVPLSVTTASTSRLTQLNGAGWIAVGDAAATYDPLASTGILRAIRSGLSAADLIGNTFTSDPSAIDAYVTTELEAFHAHLEDRRSYYRVERRWRSEPFWERRHAGTTVAA